jgi:hypothetical protein
MALGLARVVRRHERAAVMPAAGLLAVIAAGGALAAAGADALFLARLGPGAFGWALAASSLALAIVLAVVGAAADRADRAWLLGGLASGSAAALIGLALAVPAAPTLTAALALIAVKQLQGALELVAWVLIAERLDARQSARLVPLLAAASGAGTAVGALAAFPVAAFGGAAGALAAGGAVWGLAVLIGAGATRRVARPAPRAALVAAWTEGAVAVRRHPLAAQLAVLVAAAGAFAALAHYALGAAAARAVEGDAALAGFLGAVRGAVQIATLVVQLAIAPRLLRRAGAGTALLLAPLGALAAALGIAAAPGLIAVVMAQAQARLLDTAIETPAERLVQNLLPVQVRGRVAGFLEGAAKRAGAVAGGVAAALLLGAPRAVAIAMAVAALVWLVLAARLRRRLPALAVAALSEPRRAGREDDRNAAVDDSALALLYRELDGGDVRRSAELLARFHRRGRTDAVAALIAAATTCGDDDRDAVLTALVAAATHGGRVEPLDVAGLIDLATLRTEAGDATGAELAVRAAGLCGQGVGHVAAGPDTGTLLRHGALGVDDVHRRADDRGLAAVSAAAAVATARLSPRKTRVTDVDDGIRDALDDADPQVRAVGLRELTCEVLGAMSDREIHRMFEHARALVRAVRRGRGCDADRAGAVDALGEVLARSHGRASAERVLLATELIELARALADRRRDAEPPPSAPVLAASAIRLLGDLLDQAARSGTAAGSEEIRLLAYALGDRDDDVRDAAEAVLRRLGAAAAAELVVVAGYGRRSARDRALAVLAALPVTTAALDRLIDAELAALDRTCLHLGALATLGDGLVARRLDERTREIAHTVVLLVAARVRAPALAAAASHLRHAPEPASRARALVALEVALPRPLVSRLVDAVDAPPDERAAAAAARRGLPPSSVSDAVRAELAGGDRLTRALVLHALGADGRAAHRDAISAAAAGAVSALAPLELLRRINDHRDNRGDDDVPTRVETLLVLGKVPVLAELTTRQLTDLADAAHWCSAAAGELVVGDGDLLDALIVVAEGALLLEFSGRTIVAGETIDDLAVVAPITPGPVRAAHATRYLRLDRLAFDELVDDVPGLGAAVCRVLGARLRGAI